MARPKFSLLPKGRRAWIRSGIILGGFLVFSLTSIHCMTNMPGEDHFGPLLPLTVDQDLLSTRLEKHVRYLAEEIGDRNVVSFEALEASFQYISAVLGEAGYQVSTQEFEAMRATVKNIEVEIKGATLPDEIVVVGAHYDSALGCPAANDNATGVAAVLEIARSFANKTPDRTVRFVAFVNEEPPFFQTEGMGSWVYARRCRQRNENIVAMITPETIGYYTDEPDSQHYPPPFSLLYPSTGNFVAFVGNYASRDLIHQSISSFRKNASFPSEGIAAPGFITGIGWSDHWGFWQEGYPGLMVTDTAPFRYKHYHKTTDTPDKIDFDRMSRVVEGLNHVVTDLVKGR